MYIVQKAPSERKYRPCFRSFFVSEEGVISLSLRGLTLISCITITVALLTMLYLYCTNPDKNCEWKRRSPMVSTVIRQPMYDRIWCILSTFFSLSVMQVNIRAFYKRLHGIATPKQNDRLIWYGVATCISFPAIGYFDEKSYELLHYFFATTFFIATALYALKLGDQMWKHRDHFPKGDHWTIHFMWW